MRTDGSCARRLAGRRIGLVLSLAALPHLTGCATTIYPPPAVSETAWVGVLDHGQHASLVVGLPGNAMIRYAYGDWRYFALRQTGAAEATSALLWPTQAALGRKRLQGSFSPSAISREIDALVEDAVYLMVEARDARRFVERLDGIFHENAATQLYNERLDLWFVHHPEPYSTAHNSNRVIGKWLVELGCRLDGPALFSIWKRGTEP